MSGDPRSAGGVARDDVTLQRVGRESILHDARSGRAHVINASAARVWELCDGRPMDKLLTEFARPYGLSPEAVRADVERVLAGFAELDLFADPGPTV